MGSVNGIANLGRVTGYFLAPLIFIGLAFFFNIKQGFIPFQIIFFIGAVMLFIAFLLSNSFKKDKHQTPRKRLYFNRKFIKYYILEIFFGGRKQVFLTFAPYVLILKYGAKTELISFLYGIWAFFNIFFSPVVGKLIDKYGYKKIIIIDAVILVFLCIFYGFSHHIFPESVAFILICFVFVIDAMLFAVGMARAMYVKKLSDSKEELTSTLSTGLSINHLVSIIIAIGGGFLWQGLGMEMLFSMAAVFGLGSFIFSCTLPRLKN
jgi:predicted MFS family arabinose efflux permease